MLNIGRRVMNVFIGYFCYYYYSMEGNIQWDILSISRKLYLCNNRHNWLVLNIGRRLMNVFIDYFCYYYYSMEGNTQWVVLSISTKLYLCNNRHNWLVLNIGRRIMNVFLLLLPLLLLNGKEYSMRYFEYINNIIFVQQ